jgi:hypothetical protein
MAKKPEFSIFTDLNRQKCSFRAIDEAVFSYEFKCVREDSFLLLKK